ncbi:hypothetical protein CISG_07385 [Coccidioides immitis RMSCC 3703]|uniref:Uncharacterized protein n=1 Tax=Coccidioides immitis RMSCC 3703 TaxID=454286 RepID=A0A0J8R578_COCIT|nr:hypothetical protein CISG_07385 [Coccidioides immitis RMSCC 3703]
MSKQVVIVVTYFAGIVAIFSTRNYYKRRGLTDHRIEDSAEPPAFATWMASSEVDQKFLGHFATATSHTNPFLSGMLYKILGLSVVLSKKLLRARKLRRLDPTRETKSLHLYHHILWLSREGLIMVNNISFRWY